MGNIAIAVENLGKRYRIGLAEKRPDNLREAIGSFIGAPFYYLRTRLQEPEPEELIWALKNVSFEVKHGEVLGIIGRNGAGKSTLLKILSRITEPTEGQATVYGRVGSLLEVGTGFHPELTGRENIYLNGAILGMRRTEINQRFDEIVSFSDIERFIDTPVKRYSSGMYVRLAFAVAAHLNPEILLVDEVLAVGDYQFQKKCLSKMEDVVKTGRTVLFVSHNLGMIRSLCRRAILLSSGVIKDDGEVESAVTHYLSQGEYNSPIVRYQPDLKKDIQIVEVRLLDHQKKPTSMLDMLQPFTVEIDYEVRHRVNDVIIAVKIESTLYGSLLLTADFDLNRDKLKPREIGKYTTWVTIPGKLFNSGIFLLIAGISSPGKAVYEYKKVMQFELFDSGSFVAKGGGEERRNAALLLEIPWDT